MRFPIAAAIGLAFAACGEPPQNYSPGRAPPPASCAYQFNSTVLMGPDTALSLGGKLVLVQDTSTTVAGSLVPAGGDPDAGTTSPRVRVDGSISVDGKTITLTFLMPNGTRIVASGLLPAGFSSCPAPLQGNLTGPSTGDEGNWTITEQPNT